MNFLKYSSTRGSQMMSYRTKPPQMETTTTTTTTNTVCKKFSKYADSELHLTGEMS